MNSLPAGVVAREVQMADWTTMGIGGTATLLVVEDENALPDLVAQPHRFLGKGANLLVSDEPVPEPVLMLGKSFKTCELVVDGERAVATVGGAFDLALLVGRMARAGWAGLEGLAGVPASIGGALRMNAGTAHRWLHDCVQRVQVLLPGAVASQWVEADEYQAVYRDGGLPSGTWYLRAELLLQRGDPPQLQAKAAELKAKKAASQPLSAKVLDAFLRTLHQKCQRANCLMNLAVKTGASVPRVCQSSMRILLLMMAELRLWTW